MSKKGHIYRLFPGGNTSQGFYSYYHHVIDLKKAKNVYLIKGGPGVGKSQLMKTIGNNLVELGYDAEFHHCSADPDSIDAVVIPKLQIALIDGTSPHVIDPKYPGAVEEIINLGEFWQADALKNNREGIIKSIDDNSKIYKRVYKYLAAAKLIHDDIEWIYNEAIDYNAMKNKLSSLINGLNIESKQKVSSQRHLFGSAYTHKGHIHFADTYIGPIKNKFHVNIPSINIASRLIEMLRAMLIDKGYDVINYHHPLEPEKYETIILPELDVAVTSLSEVGAKTVVDTKKFFKINVLSNYEDLLNESKENFNNLLNVVFEDLKRAKVNHDFIETFYIPNINFDKVDSMREKLLANILK